MFPVPRELGAGRASVRWLVVVGIVMIVGVAPGAERSLLWTGIASTVWQPVQLFVAAWTPWRPHTLRRLAGQTIAVAVGALVLLLLAQLFVARIDLGALPRFFPVLIAPAALLFETHLQLTMVWERKPFDRFGVRGGLLALLTSLVVAVVAYQVLVTWTALPAGAAPPGFRDPGGPLPGSGLATWLITIAAWQVLIMVTLRGWPGAAFGSTVRRIVVNNVVVLGGATATVFVVEGLGVSGPVLSGVMGCIVAGGRLPYVLYHADTDRRGSLFARLAETTVWTLLVSAALWSIVAVSEFRVQPPGLWVAVVGLNLVSGGTTFAASFVGPVHASSAEEAVSAHTGRRRAIARSTG